MFWKPAKKDPRGPPMAPQAYAYTTAQYVAKAKSTASTFLLYTLYDGMMEKGTHL